MSNMINYYSIILSAQKNWVILCTVIGLISLSTSLFANNDQNTNSRLSQLDGKMDNLMTQIRQTIGDAACQTQKQCKAIPVGHRACGGPSAYLAYSTMNTDVAKLKALSQQHSLINRQFNRLKNLISTCEMILQPPVACVDSRCKIVK